MTTKRRWKKKFAAMVAIVAAVLGLLYARCADGLGFGKGDGKSESKNEEVTEPNELPTDAGATSGLVAETSTCEVRVGADSITVNAIECAVADLAKCCPSKRAILTVTGDARFGDAEAVRTELGTLKFQLIERKPAQD